MEKMVYLSIIVPCYNGEDIIETAIESVILQKRDDIELIIVDDGSKDNTEAVCKKYSGYDEMRYFRIENSGAGYARNFGMSKARGRWIAFLDADDLFIEGSLDKIIPQLHKYDENGMDVIYTATLKGDMQQNNPVLRKAEAIDKIRHVPKYEFWSCLYRKQFLDNNNIRFFEYKEQDIETAFRYRVFANCPDAVTDNDMSFYFQRINPKSNTHTWKTDVLQRVKSRVYLELLEENSLKKEDEWLLDVSLQNICDFYMNCIKNGCKNREALAHINETHTRAVRCSRTIKKNKNTYHKLRVALCFRIAANTIGRRKRG